MDETVPTNLKILTTKSRMKVLGALQANSMSKSTDDDVLRDDRRERLLSQAVNELIVTERSYQRHLDIINDFFMVPLQERSLITTRDAGVIFGEIGSIRNLNLELLDRLETKSKTIGEAFLELAPFLKVYSSYVKNFDGALALIETLEKENKEFAAFKTNQESRPEVGLKLSALLITPVQRIPRFKLLLDEIIQYTPPDSDDYKLLQDALREVTSVASLINGFLHEHDNMQKMLRIQRSLMDNQPKILIPGRKYIKEGPLMKVSRNGKRSHSRIFFLFSDMLMYCKPLADDYTMPGTLMCCCVIPIKHCTVDPLFNCGVQSGALMTLKCKDEEVLLYTDNAEYGQTWIDALRSTVRQYSEFRQTLRKESTAKRPLRRAALLKQQEESLSELSKKRKAEAEEQNNDQCRQSVKDALFPLRQMKIVQDCLSPVKKQRLELAPNESSTIENQHKEMELTVETESEPNQLNPFDCRMENQSDQNMPTNYDNNDSVTSWPSLGNRRACNTDSYLSAMRHLDEHSDSFSAKETSARKRCIIL